jgi:hypothetical protein
MPVDQMRWWKRWWKKFAKYSSTNNNGEGDGRGFLLTPELLPCQVYFGEENTRELKEDLQTIVLQKAPFLYSLHCEQFRCYKLYSAILSNTYNCTDRFLPVFVFRLRTLQNIPLHISPATASLRAPYLPPLIQLI